MICILVLLPLNALVSRARDFDDQTCAADSVNEPAWPVLALGPGTLSWDDGAFFGRHCVPSAASRLSLMDCFLCPIVLKHTRLINRILRKVLLANLGPVRRFEVGPRAVVQGVNKFLPSTVTLLVPWKRGEIQVRIFYDVLRKASNYT